jgi:hypothetical protein
MSLFYCEIYGGLRPIQERREDKSVVRNQYSKLRYWWWEGV